MICKHTRDWEKDTTKKDKCSDQIVLGGHSSHYLQCYHDKLTCNVNNWKRSGSVVECLTRDQGAAGSSLTIVTALRSLSKTHLS